MRRKICKSGEVFLLFAWLYFSVYVIWTICVFTKIGVIRLKLTILVNTSVLKKTFKFLDTSFFADFMELKPVSFLISLVKYTLMIYFINLLSILVAWTIVVPYLTLSYSNTAVQSFPRSPCYQQSNNSAIF